MDDFCEQNEENYDENVEVTFADSLSQTCQLLFETLHCIGYTTLRNMYVFTKLCTATRVSEDFQFRVSGSQNNQKCTDLLKIAFK